MVMTNEGLNRIRDLISADMTKGTLGTSGTAASVSDTGLGTADAATEENLTSSTQDQLIQKDYALASTDGTNGTYREFKIHNSTYDFDRIVFTGITWTQNGDEDIAITKRYLIRGDI